MWYWTKLEYCEQKEPPNYMCMHACLARDMQTQHIYIYRGEWQGKVDLNCVWACLIKSDSVPPQSWLILFVDLLFSQCYLEKYTEQRNLECEPNPILYYQRLEIAQIRDKDSVWEARGISWGFVRLALTYMRVWMSWSQIKLSWFHQKKFNIYFLSIMSCSWYMQRIGIGRSSCAFWWLALLFASYLLWAISTQMCIDYIVFYLIQLVWVFFFLLTGLN